MRPAPLALALALASSCLPAASAMQDAAAPPRAAQAAPATRSAPADLLTDLRDDGSLVDGLDDPSAQLRWVAARGLARLAEAEQVPVLAARVGHEPDPEVLTELVFALGQRGHFDAAAAAPPLVALLGHESPAIRAAAVRALARLADDSYTARITEMLASDPSPQVRGAAALALFRLDGARYTHMRTATQDVLDLRDAVLSTALSDDEPDVQWRASYALSGVMVRSGMARLRPLGLSGQEPLTRLFALRGLWALEKLQLIDPAALDVTRLLDDPDDMVVIEALGALNQSGSPERMATLITRHPNALVRFAAAASLNKRLDQLDVEDETSARWCELVQPAAMHDDSPWVRREIAALIVARAPRDHALFALYLLAGSDDPRDRERAAQELATRFPVLDDPELLDKLLRDEPAVAAAALLAPASPDIFVDRLVQALKSPDPALVVAAADVAANGQRRGDTSLRPVSPELTAALQAAHDRATGPEMKEARAMLRKALNLSPDTEPPGRPAAAAAGAAPAPLLQRLLAEHREALADPAPRVELLTSRGRIELQLDRVNAPRHVASFLELAAAGFYDGLDFHRVVPNFVVQGLDPRGDGYGTGGRRLPDEFSPRPYAAGTVGMPNAGEPHTGGCQLFITHIPTPHLDGNYTVLGQVTAGMDVVQRLEIGDTVGTVRRIEP